VVSGLVAQQRHRLADDFAQSTFRSGDPYSPLIAGCNWDTAQGRAMLGRPVTHVLPVFLVRLSGFFGFSFFSSSVFFSVCSCWFFSCGFHFPMTFGTAFLKKLNHFFNICKFEHFLLFNSFQI
jgi:hypothetical protein